MTRLILISFTPRATAGLWVELIACLSLMYDTDILLQDSVEYSYESSWNYLRDTTSGTVIHDSTE